MTPAFARERSASSLLKHAVVLLGHALGDGVRELQEPGVELAEVAEDERLYNPFLSM